MDAILEDVAAEPGALPLLSQALLETWKRRSGRMLTFAGYHDAGGVKGAIGHKADSVYDNLQPEQQAIARNIFVRLTSLGEGTQDTRRRVPLDELVGRGDRAEAVAAVLNLLEDARLVTAEREQSVAETEVEAEEAAETVFVDVTHEALIREWSRLDAWLHENREWLRIHRRLTEAAQEWKDLNHDRDMLFRGVLLAQTIEWAGAHQEDLNDLERAFLATSQAQVEAAELAREEMRQRELAQARALAAEERRARNRTRWLLGAVLVALVIFIGASAFVFNANPSEQLGVTNQLLEAEKAERHQCRSHAGELRTRPSGIGTAGRRRFVANYH